MARPRASGWLVVVACWLGGCMPEGEVLVDEHPHGLQVALDATHVYWTEAGKVWRVPKVGGAGELLATPSGRPVGVASNGAVVAWLTEDTSQRGTLTTLALAGGDPMVVATDIDRGTAVAMDADHLYWAAASDGNGSGRPVNFDGLVMGLPLDGGVAAPVMTRLQDPYQLVIAGGYLNVGYLDQVARVPLGGGAQELVLQLVKYAPLSVAVGEHLVFWHELDSSSAHANRLAWAPLGSGPDGRHVLLVTAVDKVSVAARGDTLFFASPGAVWRMEATDTEPTLLAASAQDLTVLRARGFAIDERRAYWASNSGLGTVPLR